MVKKKVNSHKKGIITNYYKPKTFQDSKRQFSSFPAPGESVGDAALDLEIIPYNQEVIVQEFMQKYKITKKIGIGNIAIVWKGVLFFYMINLDL